MRVFFFLRSDRFCLLEKKKQKTLTSEPEAEIGVGARQGSASAKARRGLPAKAKPDGCPAPGA